MTSTPVVRGFAPPAGSLSAALARRGELLSTRQRSPFTPQLNERVNDHARAEEPDQRPTDADHCGNDGPFVHLALRLMARASKRMFRLAVASP